MSAVRAEAGGAPDMRVAEAPGLSSTRLAWLQATSRRAWAAALWLCLVAAIAMPALFPLLDAVAVRSALVQTLASDGPLTVEQSVTDAAAFNAFKRDVDATVSGQTGSALIPLSAFVTAGPLRIAGAGGAPETQPAAQRPLSAAYLDHLATHVVMNAGVLAPDALGGGETAVTMPQAAADQLGLSLSQRICFDFATAPRTAPWCVRIVGLWQPVDARDPFWVQSPSSPLLTVGFYDFFEAVKQHPGLAPHAGLRYWASGDAIDPGQAGTIGDEVRRLSAGLATPSRHVATSLDSSLIRFHATQLQVSTAIHLTGTVVTLLGLFVVALVASRFLDGQARELAVLRARGWPGGRVWRMAALGLAILVLCAIPAAAAAGLLFVALLGTSGSGLSPGWLHRDDVLGAATAMAAITIGLIAILALMAVGAARRELDPSLEAPFRSVRAWWRRAGMALVLGCLGGIELALPKLAWAGTLSSQTAGPIPTLVGQAPALGLILLTAAAVHLLPLGWSVRRGAVAGALARCQLRRSPEQHMGVGFVLILAIAIGVFAAVGLAIGPGQPAATPPALDAGLQAGLLVGAVVALGLALAAFALHFRSIAGRRLQEYGGLLAHGLTTDEVTRSVATEQTSTTTSALVAGMILGLALAVSGLPLAMPTASTLAAAAVYVAGGLACILLCLRITGGAARRLPADRGPLAPAEWR